MAKTSRHPLRRKRRDLGFGWNKPGELPEWGTSCNQKDLNNNPPWLLTPLMTSLPTSWTRMPVCFPMRSLTCFKTFKHRLRANYDTLLSCHRASFSSRPSNPKSPFSTFSCTLSLFPPQMLETSQTPPTPVIGGSSEVVTRSRPLARKLY